MYRRIAEYTAALELFSRVLDLLKNDETVYIQRGQVYQDMGNHEKAIEDFNEAIKISEAANDRHYWSYFYLGMSYLKSRYPREALIHLTRANDLDGDSQEPRILDGLAQSYHQLGNYEEALGWYAEALLKDPKNVDFHSNLANCYY